MIVGYVIILRHLSSKCLNWFCVDILWRHYQYICEVMRIIYFTINGILQNFFSCLMSSEFKNYILTWWLMVLFLPLFMNMWILASHLHYVCGVISWSHCFVFTMHMNSTCWHLPRTVGEIKMVRSNDRIIFQWNHVSLSVIYDPVIIHSRINILLTQVVLRNRRVTKWTCLFERL